MILFFLIPVNMLYGVLPKQELLENYNFKMVIMYWPQMIFSMAFSQKRFELAIFVYMIKSWIITRKCL